MNLELIFSVANATALVGWVLLVLSPWIKLARTIVSYMVIPSLLALLYTSLIVTTMGSSPVDASFTSLRGVSALFEYRPAVLAGWVHYLVFDLIMGKWQVRDARDNLIAFPFVVPCLFMTLMFGPIGLLMYILLRRWRTGSFRINI